MTAIEAHLAHEAVNTSKHLRLTGEATIEFDDSPGRPKEARVTDVYVIYTTTTRPGADPEQGIESIVYRVADQDFETVSVHPDFLDKPEVWPEWARDLVERHRPAA